jgi:5'-nucleotidase/UDP-sugar diphosphatase
VGDLISRATLGVPELQLLKQLGFDAMAIGNHEFDYGPDTLAYVFMTAYGTDTLPLLSANLDLTAMPELATWIKPVLIKEVGGVKVGIFGMTVPGNPLSQPAPVVIRGADDPSVILQIAGEQAAALRAAGAGVVVMLSHLGLAYDQAVAANVPGIDVILSGHDHRPLAAPLSVPNAGGQTVIVQPDVFYREVAQLRLTVDAGAVSLADYSAIPLDATAPDEPSVAAAVAAIQDAVRAQYGDVYDTAIATATCDIPMTWDPSRPERDTAMGDLDADALRDRMKTDIAFTAVGFMNGGLPRGPLVPADLFHAVPYGYDEHTGFGFHLATFAITGAELLKALEASLNYLDVTEDYCLQVSGMTFRYDSRRPAGQRVLPESVRIGGKRLARRAVYTATVNEGIAMMIPAMGVQVSDLQMKDDVEYLALRDYVASRGVIAYAPEGRIVDVGVAAGGGGNGVRCFVAAAGGTGTAWPLAAAAAFLVLAARVGRRVAGNAGRAR